MQIFNKRKSNLWHLHWSDFIKFGQLRWNVQKPSRYIWYLTKSKLNLNMVIKQQYCQQTFRVASLPRWFSAKVNLLLAVFLLNFFSAFLFWENPVRIKAWLSFLLALQMDDTITFYWRGIMFYSQIRIVRVSLMHECCRKCVILERITAKRFASCPSILIWSRILQNAVLLLSKLTLNPFVKELWGKFLNDYITNKKIKFIVLHINGGRQHIFHCLAHSEVKNFEGRRRIHGKLKGNS